MAPSSSAPLRSGRTPSSSVNGESFGKKVLLPALIIVGFVGLALAGTALFVYGYKNHVWSAIILGTGIDSVLLLLFIGSLYTSKQSTRATEQKRVQREYRRLTDGIMIVQEQIEDEEVKAKRYATMHEIVSVEHQALKKRIEKIEKELTQKSGRDGTSSTT